MSYVSMNYYIKEDDLLKKIDSFKLLRFEYIQEGWVEGVTRINKGIKNLEHKLVKNFLSWESNGEELIMETYHCLGLNFVPSSVEDKKHNYF